MGSPQVGALNIFENFQVSHFHTLSSHFLVHIKNTCCTEIALNVKELEELVLNGFLDFHKPCYACIFLIHTRLLYMVDYKILKLAGILK